MSHAVIAPEREPSGEENRNEAVLGAHFDHPCDEAYTFHDAYHCFVADLSRLSAATRKFPEVTTTSPASRPESTT